MALSLAAKVTGGAVLIAATVGVGALAWGVVESGSGVAQNASASTVFDGVTSPNNWSGTGPVTVTDFEPDDTPKVSLADAEAPCATQDGVSIVAAQLVRIQVTTPILCACPMITLPPSPISPTPTPPPSPTPRLDTYLAWAIRLDTSQAFNLSDPRGSVGWGHQGQVPWVVALVNANANDGTWIALYDRPASASPTPTPGSILQFVPADEIDGTENNDKIDLAPADYTVPIRALVADQTAQAKAPNATIVQTLLVEYTHPVSASAVPRLAWAVNFDPETVTPGPLFGCDHSCPSQLAEDYFYVLIDATTGEIIQTASVSQAADATFVPH